MSRPSDTKLMKLNELLSRHEAYIESARSSGINVLSYNTPCCGEAMDTTAPSDNQIWDSLTSCPHCGGLFMKIVKKNSVKVVVAP